MDQMKSPARQERIIFAGVARDCQQFLPQVLASLEWLSSQFSYCAYIFVENDSKDSTKSIFQSWGQSKKNFHFINMDGIGQIPIRTIRLELVRNVYIEYIRNNAILSSYDYLVILDMDDANVYGTSTDKFLEAIDFLSSEKNHAGVFSNQIGTYYDMWAFRHPQLCPNDVWEEVLDYVHIHQVSDDVAFGKTFGTRVTSLDSSGGMLEVDSAFGGFGVYKLPYVVQNTNPYLGSRVKVMFNENGLANICRLQMCEHVHFHAGIKNLGGRLFVKQDLINGMNFGINFPPSTFRNYIF